MRIINPTQPGARPAAGGGQQGITAGPAARAGRSRPIAGPGADLGRSRPTAGPRAEDGRPRPAAGPAAQDGRSRPGIASGDASATPAGALPSRWAALAFIAAAQLMIALDATIVNIALPSTQATLRFSVADRQWVITAYTLAFAGLVLLGGRIADYAGRKRAFLIGLAGFAAASAVGGAANSLGMLAGARAVQGAFAALLAPTALSLLTVTFSEPRERAKAFAVYGAIAGSGAAAGLVIGGVLAQYLSWRWCLYVNVPIAIGAAVGGWVTLPASRAGSRQRLDVPGAALACAALVSFVYACTAAVTHGWKSTLVMALLGTAGTLVVIFVAVESRAATPLLPLRIVRDRNRGGAYLATALALGGLLGLYLFLTYYLQVVQGYSPVMAGLAFLPLTVATQLGAMMIAARLLPRVPPRALAGPGLLLAAAAMALLTQLKVGSGYISLLLPSEVLLGVGLGCALVPVINIATQGVDRRDAGVASAVVNTAQQAGASVGTALLNTVAASAAAGYLATHVASHPAVAMVHGYTVASAWATGMIALAAATATIMINAGAPRRRPH